MGWDGEREREREKVENEKRKKRVKKGNNGENAKKERDKTKRRKKAMWEEKNINNFKFFLFYGIQNSTIFSNRNTFINS